MLKALAILLLGAVLGVSAALLYTLQWGNEPAASGLDVRLDPNAPQLPARRAVVALGTIEPAAGIVQVGSSLMGTRIERVLVQDGQQVKEGELVVELDASAAEAELQLAKAQEADAVQRQQAEVAIAKERVASAELAQRQASEGKRLELEAARRRRELAALKVEQAKQDLAHATRLRQLAEPLATEQQVQHARVAVEAAIAEQQSAEAAIQQLEQTLEFRAQTAAAELRSARQALELAEQGAGIESLRQSVRLAELKLAHAKIAAPITGTVLHVLAHAGEIVTQQPLLQLAALDALACVAEVEAADVPNLVVGQTAIIRSRALGRGELSGKLDRVGASVSGASLRPLDPRQPVDRTVAKAVIVLDADQAAQWINSGAGDRRAALVGLQVEVEFPLAAAQP